MHESNYRANYPILEPTYLRFNSSLIEGRHKDLPNPYYKLKDDTLKQRTDYAHPTANVVRSIVNEYGKFGTLTEEKLEELIHSGGDSIGKTENGDTEMPQNEAQAQDPKSSNHEFYLKREEMLKHVRKALGTSTWSLDFISLLISSARPATGSSSLSPHIKQSLKLGSLSCDRINPRVLSRQHVESKKQEDAAKIGHGWKVQSLQKASEYIKNATSKIRDDLKKEKIYWKEVMEVLAANELITTVIAPIEQSSKTNILSSQGIAVQKRILAVRYGYADSGSNYFDSGLALLKKGKYGHLEFQKLNINEREKAWGGEYVVSVKIFQRPPSSTEMPKLIGQSNLYKILNDALIVNDDSFVSKVNNYRFFIFENELFWHLMKEASSLVSHKIQVLDTKIVIELYDHIIQIDKVDVDDESAKNPPPNLENNKKADNLLLFFKILLCANNFKNLEKHKVPPVAMRNDSNSRKTNKNAVLIKPIIMYSGHNRMIGKMKKILNKVLVDVNVQSAEAERIIQDELIIKQYVNDPNELQQFKTSRRCYNNDPFLKVCTRMAPTSLLILKNFGLKIWIELVSNYSTLHISINLKVLNVESEKIIVQSKFATKHDVYNCLLWILKDFRDI